MPSSIIDAGREWRKGGQQGSAEGPLHDTARPTLCWMKSLRLSVLPAEARCDAACGQARSAASILHALTPYYVLQRPAFQHRPEHDRQIGHLDGRGRLTRAAIPIMAQLPLDCGRPTRRRGGKQQTVGAQAVRAGPVLQPWGSLHIMIGWAALVGVRRLRRRRYAASLG